VTCKMLEHNLWTQCRICCLSLGCVHVGLLRDHSSPQEESPFQVNFFACFIVRHASEQAQASVKHVSVSMHLKLACKDPARDTGHGQ